MTTHITYPPLVSALLNVKERINSQVKDIEFRLQKGIYATEKDETAEQVHERLKAIQDKEGIFSTMDYNRVDYLVSELVQRGYFKRHFNDGY